MDAMMINNMVMMFCMSLFTPLATAFTNSTVINIKNFILMIWRFFYRKFGPKVNTVTIEHVENFDTIQLAIYTPKSNQALNLELIHSVFFSISKVETKVDSLKCILGSAGHIHKIPTSKFKYLDYDIKYHLQEKENKEGKVSTRTYLDISSQKSVDDIYNFIKKCHIEYKASLDADLNVYEYIQIPNKKHTAFMRYKFDSNTTFDSLFFPTKNRVLSLVKKLESGKLDKLAFCLHGQPGCGRTSLVKALSNLTGNI